MTRHPDLLRPGRTALMVIDIQERLVRVMPRREQLVARAARLVEAAQLLDVPVVITEQVPEKLGPIIPELAAALEKLPRISKVAFSCCGEPEVVRALRGTDATAIVLCGVETHVCVQQTALDLLVHGFRAYVCVDAVCSRYDIDHETALARMRGAGVILTTTESVLFELLQSADHEQFRALQKLVK